MSFDVDDFVGLVRGGSGTAPVSSDPDYGWSSAAEIPGDWIVGGVDFISCEQPAPLPPGGTEFRDWPANDGSLPAYYTASIPAFHGTHFDLSDAERPPDYVTLHVEISAGLQSPDLTPGSNTCEPIGSGGGPTDPVPAEFTVAVDLDTGGPSFTFAEEDSASGVHEPLKGYLRRTSTAYTGDPANTASDYLWPYSEVDTLRASIDGIFHKAEVQNIVFTVRAFWVAAPVLICLV